MTDLSFITLIVWITILIFTMDYLFGKVMLILGCIFMFTVNGWEQDKQFTHDKVTTKILVSAQPSHTQINGSIGGSFLLFSGVIGENRVYLLREEISEGLYKDFEVKHEVYIREDKTLTDKGKFTQHFKCYKISDYFDLYGWKYFTITKYKCEYKKQVISVPVGSVIKELNI